MVSAILESGQIQSNSDAKSDPEPLPRRADRFRASEYERFWCGWITLLAPNGEFVSTTTVQNYGKSIVLE